MCVCMYSHACIRMYAHVFACIVMYRKIRFGPCIEYMYRGARSIHVFGIGEIHEIHARYKGKKMEEGHDTIYMPKRGQYTTIRGKSAPCPH